MARERDYKAEYARRLANAAKRGLSRSQARGHARPGEAVLRPPTNANMRMLEKAYRQLRVTGNLSATAKTYGISTERFRRFVRDNALATRQGRSWIFTDRRLRKMSVISGERMRTVTLDSFEQASLNGEYLNAVKLFLSSNDLNHLKPFLGRSVINAKGKAYPLETNPNALHRLAAAGSELFHEIYRLVI